MKLTTILLTVFCLNASALTQAQVNFSGKDVPLEKIFEAIEVQTEFKFAYNPSILLSTQRITISLRNATVEEAMKDVLKSQPLRFKIVGRTIFLYKKDSENEPLINDKKEIIIRGKLTNEKNEPIAGATINIKGTNFYTTSNEKGEFIITDNNESGTLVISSVNYETVEFKVKGQKDINIVLKIKTNELAEVIVPYNTGYQTVPAERATGSFTYVGRKLLERNPAPTILSRLQGVTNGLLFNSATTMGGTKNGITIRGTSTISALVNKDPLIIVDNFPYEGDIANINPNDIASVTILKDAAAASIWGARSGNGVIVIATKRGTMNRRMALEANMNVTVSDQLDLHYDQKYLGAASYIGIEKYLFDQGYYNRILTDKVNYPSITPAVDLLQKHRAGLITQSSLQAGLDSLSQLDLRPSAQAALYRRMLSQQYAVNLSGGAATIAYYLGIGYDNAHENLERNTRERFTITSLNTFTPIKNLELVGSMIYSSSKVNTPNTLGWGNTLSNINRLYPYTSLTDANGQPATVNYGWRNEFGDSLRKLGFLSWAYRPLEEVRLADNQTKSNSVTLRGAAKYTFLPGLDLQIQFQSERQNGDGQTFQPEASYAVRTMINRFSQYDPSTGLFTYPFPRGGILRNTRSQLISNNFRTQLGLSKSWKDHSLTALAGAEIRQTKLTSYERISYGYNERYGSSVTVIDYITRFKTNGGRPAFITPPPGNSFGTTQRFISYYANAAYTYRGIYTLSISGRKDGANIFGVKANDRMTPLWSAGASYDLSKESFYKLGWLPYLKLRTTYGFNGNIYSGAAYLTARYGGVSDLTNLPYGTIVTPPNPELRWERVRNINFGMDFALRRDVIRGSLEYYLKQGLDLVQDIELAPSSGFPSFRGNSARTSSKGLELMLTSQNLNRELKWSTTFILNYNTDKVRSLEAKIFARNLVMAESGNMYQGNYIMGLYSFQWGGIDPADGAPIGYLNKATSKDYAAIYNNAEVADLVYHGSTRPLVFGAVRNAFTWKGFSLSANVTYKMKYYFRRPTVSLNYQNLLSGGLHTDYDKRWTKPGDENSSSVPALVYVTDENRNSVYRYSTVTAEKGDHIRLSDIAASYNFQLKNGLGPISFLQLYGYVNNVAILWKANKAGLDPDYVGEYALPAPRTYTIGIRSNF